MEKVILRITRHSIFDTTDLPSELQEAWLTRYEASNRRQEDELRRIFGDDVVIIEKSGTFTPEQVLALAAEVSADAIEAVLPPAILATLLDPYKGFKGEGGVIRAVMFRVSAPLADNPKNMVFLFENPGDDTSGYYERITKIVVETVKL